MAVDPVTDQSLDLDAEAMRTIHLSAYVDLPLAEVLARFSDPTIDDLLQEAMKAALGAVEESGVAAHVSLPRWESDVNARVAVSWHGPGESAQANLGEASIALLVVQSGRDAITELLVALPVPVAQASTISRNTHRFLDELTGRLEASAR
jgi:hypothetical protein